MGSRRNDLRLNNGLTPAEVHNVQMELRPFREAFGSGRDRGTRLLLAHAPGDRAWRRRGWLVVLRSRAKEAMIASSCDSGGAAGAGLNVVGIGQRESRKEERSDTGRRARGGAGGETCLLSDAVALLTSLEMEDMSSNTVVMFL